jgi:NAD(P)-dependent dehydrogenase (short-subunit alcohol dehydrogenase family)
MRVSRSEPISVACFTVFAKKAGESMEAAMPQQSRRIALVTGSTDGVGRFVAERLGADGWDVIVHGRDAERGAAVVATIAAVGGGARFLSADLSDLAAVRGLAEQVAKAAPRLDLLINNAGVGTGRSGAPRLANAAGCEMRFAVNYLAGFALTMRLLPLLRASAPARIVNVASVGQQAIDFDDVMLTRGYSGARAYMQSKLAEILFTFDLAERLQGTGVTVNCLHPATYMATTMVRESGVTPWSTIEQGAQAILQLATSPALEGRTGLYFDGLEQSRANAQAYDAKARARLWALSLELAGLTDEAA